MSTEPYFMNRGLFSTVKTTGKHRNSIVFRYYQPRHNFQDASSSWPGLARDLVLCFWDICPRNRNTSLGERRPMKACLPPMGWNPRHDCSHFASFQKAFRFNEKNEKNAFFENEDLVVRCGVRAMGARRGWIRLSMRLKISMRWVPPRPKSQ